MNKTMQVSKHSSSHWLKWIKVKGKKEQICICSQNTKSFSIFNTHLFIVDICPSSHPFSVNMGRVCCQTHSSKVSIKVMYFFQNDVGKNPAK